VIGTAMRVRVGAGSKVEGRARVPGDKSIAHRWLLLAASARGESALRRVPVGLDVGSTARAVLALSGTAQPSLERWIIRLDGQPALQDGVGLRDNRSGPPDASIDIAGGGRIGLREPDVTVDCGNSGTTLRMTCGLVAGSAFTTVLDGDRSLRSRPMDRVAEPLRSMGADVVTDRGRPPVRVRGGDLRSIRYALRVPSAQVKTAVLLAGLAADGETTVVDRAGTRDHTERALAALGAPIRIDDAVGAVTVGPFQHEGFSGVVPGDVSAAAFLAAAAVVTGTEVTVQRVGLNPTRTGFLDVIGRMGARVDRVTDAESLGEPEGRLVVGAGSSLRGTTISDDELPRVIDEVPVLAVVAACAAGESRFRGAGELRVKESDRLEGLVRLIRGLGGDAAVEGEDLVVDGTGLRGGFADSGGDHRMAMAAAVGALGAAGPSEIEGIEAADVSFPEFWRMLVELGARIEVAS